MLKPGDIVRQCWFAPAGTYDDALFRVRDVGRTLCPGTAVQDWVHVVPLNKLARACLKETHLNGLKPGINSCFFFLANGLIRARHRVASRCVNTAENSSK